jgi:hypothetical protein
MEDNKFLGKGIGDITIEDLLEYFLVEQEETSTIEFKSGDVSLEKIYPEICAFLNTNGGILIIGAPNKLKVKDKEIYKGELIPSKIIKSSFILLQKISSAIVPAGLNINIKELNYQDGKIFILDIPQSKYPPHQNSLDGKYYIRLESETTKAPHGFIQALFNKRQYPDLHINLSLHTDNKNKKHIISKLYNKSLITALKGGYIIHIYGVKSFSKVSVEKQEEIYNNVHIHYYKNGVIENEDGNNFTYKENFETLNKGLLIEKDFIIDTLESNYLLCIVFWAKDTELKFLLLIVDPNDDNIIYETREIVNDFRDLFIKYNIDA